MNIETKPVGLVRTLTLADGFDYFDHPHEIQEILSEAGVPTFVSSPLASAQKLLLCSRAVSEILYADHQNSADADEYGWEYDALNGFRRGSLQAGVLEMNCIAADLLHKFACSLQEHRKMERPPQAKPAPKTEAPA